MGIRITETKRFLPIESRDNLFYEEKFELPVGWIETRTGIKTRHYALNSVTSSDLAYNAAKNLTNASKAQFLLNATASPDSLLPSNANRIAEQLGLVNPVCFDLMAGCSGFLHLFVTAYSLLNSGLYTAGIITASEKMSTIIDQEDKNTASLFGDAGAAWFVEYDPNNNVHAIYLGSDSTGVSDLLIPVSTENKRQMVKMDGKKVYKNAVNKLAFSISAALDSAKMTIEDIDYIISHQANARIIEQVRAQLGAPEEKVLLSITHLGNISNASIPFTFDLYKEQLIGKTVIFTAFGAGYNYGAIVLTILP